MEIEKVIPAVKAAAALISPLAGVPDVEDTVSLEKLGITKDRLADFKRSLHSLLTTGVEEPIALTKFSKRLKITTQNTIHEIAVAAAGLVVLLPKCSTEDPVPDMATCQIWMARSFFCRVRRAVGKWADPAAVPAFGITPDLKLGELVPDFDDGERLRLVQKTNQESVFRPFDVVAADPGSNAVDAGTTVQGYAKVLWDNNPTRCSIIVDFPE